MATSWTIPSRPSATPWSTRIEPASIFLMTQLLDYLMTQDDNYIVLQSSTGDTEWTLRPTI